MEAMYGAIQCLVVLGDLDEAEQQLEFLAEVSVSTGKSASLPYLMAQLCWRKHRQDARCRDLLDESLEIQKKVGVKSHRKSSQLKFYYLIRATSLVRCCVASKLIYDISHLVNIGFWSVEALTFVAEVDSKRSA